MLFAFIHHESLIQSAQILQGAIALVWMALAGGAIRFWWRKKK